MLHIQSLENPNAKLPLTNYQSFKIAGYTINTLCTASHYGLNSQPLSTGQIFPTVTLNVQAVKRHSLLELNLCHQSFATSQTHRQS